jgi:nucleotide-binding universal stress UspA family protein
MRDGAAQAVGRPVEAALLDGPAAPEIARAALALKLDLLVTGTHGRRGFRHLVLGSVAERLVHLAPCSVLVVRK